MHRIPLPSCQDDSHCDFRVTHLYKDVHIPEAGTTTSHGITTPECCDKKAPQTWTLQNDKNLASCSSGGGMMPDIKGLAGHTSAGAPKWEKGSFLSVSGVCWLQDFPGF